MKFRTILADPPWPYDNSARGAIIKTVKRDGSIAKGVHVHDQYTSLSLSEIKKLNVLSFVDENAHLYLWTTNAFMVEAHDVARAWGFVPKTIITWMKTKHENPQEPSMKTGYYFRGATEHCIFAVRGSLPLKSTRTVSTAFLHSRLPHSVKPEKFYDLIEEMSPSPRLELFARQRRDGWDAWGNEIVSTVRLKMPV